MYVFYYGNLLDRGASEWINMDIVNTGKYLQRMPNNNECENCYVYVDRDGQYYIQVNESHYNWSIIKGKLHNGIFVTDLNSQSDIEILNARYGTYLLTTDEINALFSLNKLVSSKCGQ